MSEVAVREIIEKIEELSAEDRLLLDARLEELAEAAWRRESASARAESKAKGINQATIDREVEQLRYPR